MNFPFVLSSLVNFFFWFTYAILTKDAIYFTSQFFGFVCMAFNLTIYMWAQGSIDEKEGHFRMPIHYLLKFVRNYMIGDDDPNLEDAEQIKQE